MLLPLFTSQQKFQTHQNSFNLNKLGLPLHFFNTADGIVPCQSLQEVVQKVEQNGKN